MLLLLAQRRRPVARIGAARDELHPFERARGGEGPAPAARALILHRRGAVAADPVDRVRQPGSRVANRGAPLTAALGAEPAEVPTAPLVEAEVGELVGRQHD